jgi:glycosyltransferase involved in cell wall biosynthesis
MKGKRILFICPHPENVAPGQRLKYEQYFDYLRQSGFELTIKPFESTRFWKIKFKRGPFIFLEKIFWTIIGYIKRFFLLFSIPGYDVVYVFLWVTPLGPPFFERLVAKISKKMIYDIDDLIFLKNTSMESRFIDSLKGRKKPVFLMKKADHVITCTPYLDEFVRKYNPETTDISSTINTEKYLPKKDYSIDKDKIILGWSGSVSTTIHLKVLEPVFQKLKEEGIPFKLLAMGDERFYIEGIEIEALPWKESYEIDVISRFDIGLYPLPDKQWVYGKSGLKALQYMAAGIPTVATAIGTNFRIIENNVNGFLVTTESEWIEALKLLMKDEATRRRIGEKGREIVATKFSINANKDVYKGILLKVINS